jgi:endogenous inhibitor of DNA gyrase (YacG/DUF329 family)
MRCPICKREFESSTSTALPFCSDRCRTIDLGRWLSETYSMPDPEADELPDDRPGAEQDGTSHEP